MYVFNFRIEKKPITTTMSAKKNVSRMLTTVFYTYCYAIGNHQIVYGMWPVSRGWSLLNGTGSCLWGNPEASDCSVLTIFEFEYRIVNGLYSVSNDHDIFFQITTNSPIMTFLPIRLWTHGGCNRSAEDAKSSMASYPISIFFKGPFLLFYNFSFGLLIWTMFVITTSFSIFSKLAKMLENAQMSVVSGFHINPILRIENIDFI